MSDFDRLKKLLQSNKKTIKKQEQMIKNKDLNIKVLRKKLENKKNEKNKNNKNNKKNNGWGAYINCMKKLEGG
jgi:hypothetical protein